MKQFAYFPQGSLKYCAYKTKAEALKVLINRKTQDLKELFNDLQQEIKNLHQELKSEEQ